jgi:hypothetical protein
MTLVKADHDELRERSETDEEDVCCVEVTGRQHPAERLEDDKSKDIERRLVRKESI